jgi:hypothetical protein
VPDLFTRAGSAFFFGFRVGNYVIIGIVVVPDIQRASQEQILIGPSFITAIKRGVAVIRAPMTGLVVTYIGKMQPYMIEGLRK